MHNKILSILTTKWLRLLGYFSRRRKNSNKEATMETLIDYKKLEYLFDKYSEHQKSSLTKGNLLSIQEIKRRIQRISFLSSQIMDLNNQLLTKDDLLSVFSVDGDSIIMDIDGQKTRVKFKSLDPSKPVQIEQTDKASAYVAKPEETKEDENQLVLKIELEEKLESYYQNAHKIINLSRELPGLKNLKCMEIKIVRNKLIEHPTGEHIYSFSYSESGGPAINPVKPKNTENEFYDNGFLHNSEIFIQRLSEKIDKIIKES